MGSRKSNRGFSRLSQEHKKMIAQWIIDHPDLTVKQVSIDLSIHIGLVYRIINEFLDIRTVYSFKSPEKPAERPLDEELP